MIKVYDSVILFKVIIIFQRKMLSIVFLFFVCFILIHYSNCRDDIIEMFYTIIHFINIKKEVNDLHSHPILVSFFYILLKIIVYNRTIFFIEIPLFHVLNARITFGNIFGLDQQISHVDHLQESNRITCLVDDICFEAPNGYIKLGKTIIFLFTNV